MLQSNLKIITKRYHLSENLMNVIRVAFFKQDSISRQRFIISLLFIVLLKMVWKITSFEFLHWKQLKLTWNCMSKDFVPIIFSLRIFDIKIDGAYNISSFMFRYEIDMYLRRCCSRQVLIKCTCVSLPYDVLPSYTNQGRFLLYLSMFVWRSMHEDSEWIIQNRWNALNMQY